MIIEHKSNAWSNIELSGFYSCLRSFHYEASQGKASMLWHRMGTGDAFFLSKPADQFQTLRAFKPRMMQRRRKCLPSSRARNEIKRQRHREVE